MITNRSRLLSRGAAPAATHTAPAGPALDIVMAQVKDLVLDPRVQSRESMNMATVDEYAERMQAGDEFPALTVWEVTLPDGSTILVVSKGFHRTLAARRIGREQHPAILKRGTLRDAIWDAIGDNADGTLPRSNADKVRAVTRCLEDAEWGQMSDHAIAQKCKVSQSMVTRRRNEMLAQRAQGGPPPLTDAQHQLGLGLSAAEPEQPAERPKRMGRDGIARRLSERKPASAVPEEAEEAEDPPPGARERLQELSGQRTAPMPAAQMGDTVVIIKSGGLGVLIKEGPEGSGFWKIWYHGKVVTHARAELRLHTRPRVEGLKELVKAKLPFKTWTEDAEHALRVLARTPPMAPEASSRSAAEDVGAATTARSVVARNLDAWQEIADRQGLSPPEQAEILLGKLRSLYAAAPELDEDLRAAVALAIGNDLSGDWRRLRKTGADDGQVLRLVVRGLGQRGKRELARVQWTGGKSPVVRVMYANGATVASDIAGPIERPDRTLEGADLLRVARAVLGLPPRKG